MIKTPRELVTLKFEEAKKKEKLCIWKLVMLGIMAGIFIAIGASSANVAVHAIENAGVAKLVAGCIFPVGLMMIVIVGGELFTGDCMLIFGWLRRELSLVSMLRILGIVFISNLAGSLILAVLVFESGQWNMSTQLLGAYTIKVAMGKVSMSFVQALSSGILCNIIVCIAVLFAGAASDVTGKILGCFFPIMSFVTGGYEHCVANMYYISAGIMALGCDSYRNKAMEIYGYTADELSKLSLQGFFANMLPVTLGNIIGGMVFVALPLYLIHSKSIDK